LAEDRLDGALAFEVALFAVVGRQDAAGEVIAAAAPAGPGFLAPVGVEGAAAVRTLMQTMERNRIRRLRSAGFDAPTARCISELHTPNLM
jgi:hypothetical protein